MEQLPCWSEFCHWPSLLSSTNLNESGTPRACLETRTTWKHDLLFLLQAPWSRFQQNFCCQHGTWIGGWSQEANIHSPFQPSTRLKFLPWYHWKKGRGSQQQRKWEEGERIQAGKGGRLCSNSCEGFLIALDTPFASGLPSLSASPSSPSVPASNSTLVC